MLLQSLVCILISIFAGLFTNKLFNINDLVKSNWSSFQCTTVGSWLYPFFGPSDVSLADNEAQCQSNKFDSMFSSSIEGTNSNVSSLTNATNEMNSTVNSIRDKISSIERSVFTDINNIWQKIWSLFYKIVQLFIIFYGIIQRIVAIFLQVLSIGAAAFYTFGALWNGTIGNLARFFCFHPNTLIKTTKGYKKIKDLKLGTKLCKNNYITSIFKFNAIKTPLYNYKNIIVSGSHLVYENNKWIRVKDSEYAIPFKSNVKYIYCLNTSKNIIKTKYNLIFKDFEECISNDYETKYYNMVLNHLNNEKEHLENINFSIQGFDKNTLINTENGLKKINKIKIGTKLDKNNKVIGISKSFSNNLVKYRNTILSSNNIVFENNKWILVSESKFSKKINKKCILYHLQTTNTNINTKYFISKSFFPTKNNNILNSIDKLV